jgi:hypothetical protein
MRHRLKQVSAAIVSGFDVDCAFLMLFREAVQVNSQSDGTSLKSCRRYLCTVNDPQGSLALVLRTDRQYNAFEMKPGQTFYLAQPDRVRIG